MGVYPGSLRFQEAQKLISLLEEQNKWHSRYWQMLM
jgi:hypothetical protein